MQKQLIFFALFASLSLATIHQFTATVLVSQVPGISGYLPGTMTYFYNTTGSNNYIRYDWGAPIDVTELYVYQNNIRYQKCQSCFSETWSTPAPQLWVLPSDTATSYVLPGTTCTMYTRVGDPAGIAALWVDSSGSLCQIKNLNGTLTVLSGYSTSITMSDFTAWTGWSCPQPTCGRVMDLVLVVDKSGSISTSDYVCTGTWWSSTCVKYPESEWQYELDFVGDIASSYTISATQTTIGATFFSSSALLVSPLTASLTNFENSYTSLSPGGDTCIGCGLHEAEVIFDSPVPGRTSLNPSKMVILMTDGQNNVNTYSYTTEANILKGSQYNALILCIGIGPDADMAMLNSVSTKISGVQTVFNVSSEAYLTTILNDLVLLTCQDLPTQQCSGCAGYCSCGQTCICPLCENQTNAKCIDYSCNPSTKACQPSTISCDDGNACTVDTCNNATGCSHTHLVCDDNNACTQNLCSTSSGCYYPQITCPGNDCYTAMCDPAAGCYTVPVNCNGGNNCMHYSCVNSTGCTSTPVVCTAPNMCLNSACDSSTGSCVESAVVCNDNNPCTTDTCDNSLGCIFTPIDCNDNITCTNDFCSAGMCNHTQIPGCVDLCQEWPKNCNAAPYKKPCMYGQCTSNMTTNSSTYCSYTPYNQSVCDSNSMCIVDLCNPTYDNCTHTKVTCSPKSCNTVVCDPTSGCVYTPIDCSLSDPCWIGYCDATTGSCQRKSACASQSCMDATCDSTTGKAVCTYAPRNCSTGSMCIFGWCDNATNACVQANITCNDHNACTQDSCNPSTGCVFTNLTCNDNDLCTLDLCNVTTGCYHPPTCNDGLFCTQDLCNAITGNCSFPPIDCNLDLSAADQSCYVSACTETLHCYKKYSLSAAVDVCGGCINVLTMNGTANITAASTACLSSWTTSKLVAALTGAAVAGIIIAAVIGGLVVLAASSFGTYELVKRAREAGNQKATTNPLYKDSGREMTNTAYTGN